MVYALPGLRPGWADNTVQNGHRNAKLFFKRHEEAPASLTGAPEQQHAIRKLYKRFSNSATIAGTILNRSPTIPY